DRFHAALEGVRKVWPAVVASTLTTVLVFVPIIFIQEEAGQLYSDIAIAVSASILASMIVAITIVPTACARIDFNGHKRGAKLPNGDGGLVVGGVKWLLGSSLRSLTCILAVAGASAAVIVYLTPPAEYLPEGEEPKVFARMNAPPGYNLVTMRTIGKELQDELLPFVNDDPARFKRGETDVPALKYLFMRVTPEGLRIISETVDPNDIDALMAALTAKYQKYPGMRAFATRGSIITSNDAGTRSVSLDISGPRLEDIYAVATAAYARAGEVFDNPRIKPDPPTLTLSQPLIEIRPDWERAAELGMTAQELGFTVAALTDGAFAGYFYLNDEKIDIFFYSRERFGTALDSVGQLPVYTPQGIMVPLTTLAQVKETVDTSTIRRINAKRTVTLNIIPPPAIALETGVEMVRKQIVDYLNETGQVPQGVTMGISGASDQLEATRNALAGNYIVAVIIIYLLLVAVFSHWGYPILIMTTIPLGVASGLIGLHLLNAAGGLLPAVGLNAIHQPFDMISMLGFLILMGTVVNNPILIVDRAVYNVRQMGLDAHAAVTEAVAARFRPIIMSTITTICGLAPLVFIPGAGTELYRGVGVIVLFGILGSAIVTLTFLPALTFMVLRYAGYTAARAPKEVIPA
ncbi:MAG: efflux RND transporter permease subunit, partial [Hyphomicrobium sp.]